MCLNSNYDGRGAQSSAGQREAVEQEMDYGYMNITYLLPLVWLYPEAFAFSEQEET